MKIIDVHTHNFPVQIVARAIRELTNRTRGLLAPSGDGSLMNHLDLMERAGITRAVLCPVATKPTQFDVLRENAKAIREGRMGERARKMIEPAMSVHPEDSGFIRHLELIAEDGFKVVKVHPYYQNFSLSDIRVVPFFEVIASLGLIVQCHCGEDVGFENRVDACGPSDIATLLKRVPNLKFIAAHCGGCAGQAAHATDILLDLGCYIDTSALARNQHHDEEMRILHSWPRDRILFGSDHPWASMEESISWVKRFRHARDWEALFHGNAERLLGESYE